ncbi:MAG: hypothetical protein EOO38_10345 [Cytophagaceae bacterium]|nr:MAG: hypothetical protein EOO38_10345 [Cytophagaceae bacterium]
MTSVSFAINGCVENSAHSFTVACECSATASAGARAGARAGAGAGAGAGSSPHVAGDSSGQYAPTV